jgi:ketosteroid isomerase-like protein
LRKNGDIDLASLAKKDSIRDLVLSYSRAIDRMDFALLRDLYTEDATDKHGDTFDGSASDYCQFIENSLPHVAYSGHHVCNHLISVDGDAGSGEVYALAYHVVPTASGGQEEDFMAVRYLDNYRRCEDGLWRFSRRVVTYDLQIRRPFTGQGLLGQGAADPSYQVCAGDLFKRGARDAALMARGC